MDIVTPGIGLIFWTGILFLTVLIILSRIAFKPIVKALKARETNINTALQEAKKARNEVAELETKITKMEQAARQKRENILKEAQTTASQIVQQAQVEAKNKQSQMMTEALATIEMEKQKAIKDIKNEVGNLALTIAEKVLRNSLDDNFKHQNLISHYIEDYHKANHL